MKTLILFKYKYIRQNIEYFDKVSKIIQYFLNYTINRCTSFYNNNNII